MKEIKLSPNIAENDIQYRVRQANKFLEKGNQVKITLQFKGREKLYEGIGLKTITNFVSLCIAGKQYGSMRMVEGRGKQIVAILNPNK